MGLSYESIPSHYLQVSIFALWAIITEYHRLGTYNQQRFISYKAGESESQRAGYW